MIADLLLSLLGVAYVYAHYFYDYYLATNGFWLKIKVPRHVHTTVVTLYILFKIVV